MEFLSAKSFHTKHQIETEKHLETLRRNMLTKSQLKSKIPKPGIVGQYCLRIYQFLVYSFCISVAGDIEFTILLLSVVLLGGFVGRYFYQFRVCESQDCSKSRYYSQTLCHGNDAGIAQKIQNLSKDNFFYYHVSFLSIEQVKKKPK